MAFRTKLDFSSNRQVKQRIETFTVLSGGTSFGVPFSSLPTGPDLGTLVITFTASTLLSTFSGNSATTVYSWYYPNMNIAINSLSAITPSNSGVTQSALGFVPSSYMTVDGNIVASAYSGVSFDVIPVSITDLGGGNYLGSVQTDLIEYLTASSLDFTGRTIWNDVSGITRTQDLIITNNPIIGNSWVCVDSEGKGGWSGTPVWILSTGPNSATLNGGTSVASGSFSVAEGSGTYAIGDYSHAEGNATSATTNGDHAEGIRTLASGGFSHAEGFETIASGLYGHAEGASSIASGAISHAEGYSIASGDTSHAEGYATIAGGNYSHAEGLSTRAMNTSSHAGGNNSTASGTTSFVHGYYSVAGGSNTIVLGANITGLVADTTYVDRLNIKTLVSGTSINNLGFDSSGRVIIGSSSPITIINTNSLFSTGLIGSGQDASGVTYSNLFGVNAGYQASGSNNSNFFGQSAGYGAIDASNSNFIGYQAGYNAKNAFGSNFLGQLVGYQASGASGSNFLGYWAGYQATDAYNANFFGTNAGLNATNASNSNLIGAGAGYYATNANSSNFLGSQAGQSATNASYSNFLGYRAGYTATGASNSNFFGQNTGRNASSALYSNMFGYNVGNGDTLGSVGSKKIIIGKNISLSAGTTDSINLGGVLFGTGTYSITTGNPNFTGQTNGRIGVNVVTPTESLDISGNARIRTIGAATSSGALYYTSSGVLTTNTSDIRLKHNIKTLTNALDKVKQLRGVSYDWIDEDGPSRIGFIAQEVESIIPELTFVNNNSPEKYMGVHYENTVALLVEAIKELISGTTLVGNLQTQTILAEDNNIDLNHNGTPTTALGGGITVLHAMGLDLSAELITDENGNWVTNNDFIPNKITIPNYTPSGSTDINGNLGNVTRDDDYLYIRTLSGWKRTNLESF